MRIGLIDVDSKIPNLALMKISAWHKAQGDSVEWFDPLFSKCDVVYASKVFTFTPDYSYYPDNAIKGGTGYVVTNRSGHAWDKSVNKLVARLRKRVDVSVSGSVVPDYTIYGAIDFSMGFLTRGCPNKCSWCLVPEKEGDIRPESDIEDFIQHDKVLLMDNNVLAHEHGIKQIEKIGKMRVKIDFNQGLDARLIDKQNAKLLSKCRWWKPLRLACDSRAQMPFVEKAVNLLREAGVTPISYFCYVLVKDIDDALERVEFLRSLKVDPFAQPYRDFTTNKDPTAEQKRFARWVNHKAIFKTVKWEDYR